MKESRGEKMAGFFISFEGIDKSGKSTQAMLLAEDLYDRGYDVLVTSEPGATQLGVHLRALMRNWSKKTLGMNVLDGRAEMFLFSADRAQHVHEVIMPALNEGKVVISDRYVDSTWAYQGYGRGVDVRNWDVIQDVATGGVMPDQTFWMDVDVETARQRGLGVGWDRWDHIEMEGGEFFERVRQGFKRIWEMNSRRIFRVDGARGVGVVFEDVKKKIESHIYFG